MTESIRNNRNYKSLLAAMLPLVFITGCTSNTPTDRGPVVKEVGSTQCSLIADQGQRILCFGKDLQGIFFGYGMGHSRIKTFDLRCPDPQNPPAIPPNAPHSGIANPINNNRQGNGNMCAVDGASDVWIPINHSFDTDYGYYVRDMERSGLFRVVSPTEAKLGDIAVDKPRACAEIVITPHGNQADTWGACHTGSAVGQDTMRVATYLRIKNVNSIPAQPNPYPSIDPA